MGAGRFQEAEWTLVDDIRAGEWLLVADCLVIQPVDMRFEIIWRKAAGGDDTVVVSWEQHYDPPASNPNVAVMSELRGQGTAIGPGAIGDQLIWRYTGLTGTIPMAWVPNGDGARTGGRVPYLTPP